MNKLKLDPLENEFSRLKNLEDFADDSVWQGINVGLHKEEKKKKRIIVWFFTCALTLVLGTFGWLNYTNNSSLESAIALEESKQPIATDKMTKNNVENNHKPIFNHLKSGRNKTDQAISKHNQEVFSMASELHVPENKTNISEGLTENEKLSIKRIEKLVTKEGALNLEFITIQSLKTNLKLYAPAKYLNSIEILGGRSLILNPKNSFTTIGSQWNAGFNFAKSLNKNLTFSLGLNFEAYQLKGTSFADQPNRYVSDSVLAINHKREIFYYKFYDTTIITSSISIKRQVFQIALPVGIRYKVFEKNKFNIELKGDAILGYNLSKKEVFNTTMGTKLLASQYTDFNQFSHKINFRLGAGLRFNYTVYKQNSVFISPTVSYALGGMKNTFTQNTVNPLMIGVQAGFSTKF